MWAPSWKRIEKKVLALKEKVDIEVRRSEGRGEEVKDMRRKSKPVEPIAEFTESGDLVSFRVTALQIDTFYVTAVTVARNGYTCGSHALYVCQGCQAACLSCIGPIQWRLVNSSAVVFTHLSLRSSTVPTASVASFDSDEWT